MIVSNSLHCAQSTYNLRQISRLAMKVHDSTTRKYLADKIIARHTFCGVSGQVKAVNHALRVLGDSRRVE
jgi:hypothetical protein